jgi:hypothetical protein
MSVELLYKTCTSCNHHKLVNEYHKHKNGKFGRASICKLCIIMRKYPTNHNEIPIIHETNRVCTKCRCTKEFNEFYQNNTREGYMKICKNCYIHRNQAKELTLSNYFYLLLKQLIKKYPEKNFQNITTKHLLSLWKNQNGKCHITHHPLTHEKDKSGNIDTIWNASLFIKNIDDVHSIDIELKDIVIVCHLVSTLKKMYNFSLEKMDEIYQEIVSGKNKTIL